MADERSPIQFEDVPLDQARLMGRGPRMEPMLYDTLRKKLESLSTEAVRVHLGPEITRQRMRNYILHIAKELGVPVTIRRVPGGVIFWRSTVEDIELAHKIGERLQAGQRPGRAIRPRQRRRG